jgi:hypothetical protein
MSCLGHRCLPWSRTWKRNVLNLKRAVGVGVIETLLLARYVPERTGDVFPLTHPFNRHGALDCKLRTDK